MATILPGAAFGNRNLVPQLPAPFSPESLQRSMSPNMQLQRGLIDQARYNAILADRQQAVSTMGLDKLPTPITPESTMDFTDVQLGQFNRTQLGQDKGGLADALKNFALMAAALAAPAAIGAFGGFGAGAEGLAGGTGAEALAGGAASDVLAGGPLSFIGAGGFPVSSTAALSPTAALTGIPASLIPEAAGALAPGFLAGAAGLAGGAGSASSLAPSLTDLGAYQDPFTAQHLGGGAPAAAGAPYIPGAASSIVPPEPLAFGVTPGEGGGMFDFLANLFSGDITKTIGNVASLAGGIGSLVTGGAQADAAQTAAQIQAGSAQQGQAEVRRQFDKLVELMTPYVTAGTQAIGAQGNLIGLGGAGAQAAAIQALEQSPEFQALTRTGETAILQNAAATGGLRGGNTQAALAQFRPELLARLINQQYNRLGGLASLGQASAAGQGAAGQAQALSISDLLAQQGAALAGGQLAAGSVPRQTFADLLKFGGTILGAKGF